MRGGVDIVQLRDKDARRRGGGGRASRAFRGHDGALFILNDRPDLVEACGADGVHVGQDDETPPQARAAVGPDRIVGRSTHAPDQAAAAAPIRTSTTSPSARCTRRRPSPAARRRADYVAPRGQHGGQAVVRDRRTGRRQRHEVVARGATRIVVVRAITEADDPEARGAARCGRHLAACPQALLGRSQGEAHMPANTDYQAVRTA